MPSLSDKLKSLGVKVGAQDIPTPHARINYSIEHVLPGRFLRTPAGEVYVVEEVYPPEFTYGNVPLRGLAPLNTLLEWAGYGNRIVGKAQGIMSPLVSPDQFAYFDIETTGLSGGTGTYAFLVGLGKFVGEDFLLSQFFMRDPIEEPALLLALEECLAPIDGLVSYNGKSFDVPIVNTRYIAQGWVSPFSPLPNVDLLHLSRRIWRDRLPSRTLGNIETFILGARRTEEDIPGWMIPQLYFDYLLTGDARPLKNVFYHNAMDILALAALFNYLSSFLSDPFIPATQDVLDMLGLGRLYEDLGYTEQACQIYRYCLENGMPEPQLWDAVQRLSYLRKKSGDYETAVVLWRQAAEEKHIYAHVELAKYYEHHVLDYSEATQWTLAAIEIIRNPQMPASVRQTWEGDLEHRLRRLERLMSRGG